MKLDPFREVDDLPFSAGPADVRRRRGPPIAHTRNDIGLDELDYGDTVFLATPEHQWGLAPFHYTQDVYRRFLTELGRFAAR